MSVEGRLANKDITNLIERLEAFEDHLGVSLEGLFAQIQEPRSLKVNGEVHLQKPTAIVSFLFCLAAYSRRPFGPGLSASA